MWCLYSSSVWRRVERHSRSTPLRCARSMHRCRPSHLLSMPLSPVPLCFQRPLMLMMWLVLMLGLLELRCRRLWLLRALLPLHRPPPLHLPLPLLLMVLCLALCLCCLRLPSMRRLRPWPRRPLRPLPSACCDVLRLLCTLSNVCCGVMHLPRPLSSVRCSVLCHSSLCVRVAAMRLHSRLPRHQCQRSWMRVLMCALTCCVMCVHVLTHLLCLHCRRYRHRHHHRHRHCHRRRRRIHHRCPHRCLRSLCVTSLMCLLVCLLTRVSLCLLTLLLSLLSALCSIRRCQHRRRRCHGH
jgi:hypothetical protein